MLVTLLTVFGFLYTVNGQSCVPLAFNLRTIRYYDFLTRRIASTGLAVRYEGFNYLKRFHALQVEKFKKTGCDFQFPRVYSADDRNKTVSDFLKGFKNHKGELYSEEIIQIAKAVETIMWYGGKHKAFATCVLTVMRDEFLKMQERCLHNAIEYKTERMQPVSILPDLAGDPELQLNIKGYITLEMMSIMAASACPNANAVLTAVTHYSQRDYCQAISKAYSQVCRAKFEKTCPDLTFCHKEFVSNPDPNLAVLMKRTWDDVKKCRDDATYTPPGSPSAEEIFQMVNGYIRTLGFTFLKKMRTGAKEFGRELSELMELIFHITRVAFNPDVCDCVNPSARVLGFLEQG